MPIREQELTGLFAQVKTIAVIGATDRPGRPADRIGRYLMEQGFEVLPVHPKRTGVWGLTTYPDLRDIPVPVDLVNLFRRAEFCPQHARETLALPTRPQAFWMQSGITSPEARDILRGSGITVIEDRCIMIDHSTLERQ